MLPCLGKAWPFCHQHLVTSIPSCSLESALPLRSPSPISGFRLERELYRGRGVPVCFGTEEVCVIFIAVLHGLSEETCSRFHQFRRSVSNWRFRGLPSCRLCPPGVLFLLGCPLQRPTHPLWNTQEFQVQGFLPLGLFIYLLSNIPIGSGNHLPWPTFSASETSVSSPIYLT